MKRRTVLRSILGAPAVAAAAHAQTPPPPPPSPAAVQALKDDEVKLELSSPDVVGEPSAKFLTTEQFATLEHLCDLISPGGEGRAGAKDAEVAPFLDFLLTESPELRQMLYTQGLDQLDIDARRLTGKSFAKLSAKEAEPLLASLKLQWTYAPPKGLVDRFLREAKSDILRATVNSKAYAEASRGSRRAAGMNTYWHVID